MRLAIIVGVLLLCTIAVPSGAQNVIRIGSVLPTEGSTVNDHILIKNGQQMWKDTVNARGGIRVNGTNYNVEIIELGTAGNGDAVANATRHLIDNENVDFVLLPVTTHLGLPGAIVANDLKVNSLLPSAATPSNYICDETLSYPCTLPFGRRLKYTSSLIQPTTRFMVEALNLLAVSNNVKTIAVYWEDIAFTRSIAEGALRSIEFLGMDLVYNKSITFSSNATRVQPEIDELISVLKEKKPDVVLGGTFFSCIALLETAKRMNYNANAFLLSRPCPIHNLGKDSRYVMVAGANWDKRLRSERYDENDNNVPYHHFISNGTETSPILFNNKYLDMYGMEPGTVGMIGYSAGYIIQYAYETANSFDADKLQEAINAIDITGFCGEYEFDQFGQNLGRSGLTVQLDENVEYQIIAPLFAVTDQFVYPAPKWDERETTYGWYKYTSELVILCMVASVILITLGLIVWILIFHNHIVIRASQPLFVILALVGTIVMYCSIFFWTLHTDDVHCTLVRWFLAIGFGLTYGAMFARIYRIGQIFLVKSLDVFKVTNMMIIPIVAIIVSIEIVILTLWTIVSIGQAELVEEAPFILSDDHFTCATSTRDTIFFAILMLFNAGVLVYGLYWVYKIWKLKAILYNESRSIGFAVYNLTFFIIIIIVIQVFGSSNREVAFVLRSVCLILGPFISILSLLIPRMYYMTKSEEELKKSTGGSTSSRVMSGTFGPGGFDTSENELQQKVDTLEKSNADLKQRLAEMKRKLEKVSRGNFVTSEVVHAKGSGDESDSSV